MEKKKYFILKMLSEALEIILTWIFTLALFRIIFNMLKNTWSLVYWKLDFQNWLKYFSNLLKSMEKFSRFRFFAPNQMILSYLRLSFHQFSKIHDSILIILMLYDVKRMKEKISKVNLKEKCWRIKPISAYFRRIEISREEVWWKKEHVAWIFVSLFPSICLCAFILRFQLLYPRLFESLSFSTTHLLFISFIVFAFIMPKSSGYPGKSVEQSNVIFL